MKKISLSLALLLFSGCQTATQIATGLTDQLKMQHHQVSDYYGLTSHYISKNDLDSARLYAEKIYYHAERAEAFLSIAEKELYLEGDSRPKTLENITKELEFLKASNAKIDIQENLLDLLYKIDPEHIRPEITARINSVFADFNTMINEFSEEGQITHILRWARKKFLIYPTDCLKEISSIDKRILQIKSASKRAPFLVDRIAFEIEVTQDISAAKSWLNSANQTIAMIANQNHREKIERNLSELLDKHSSLFCD